MCSNHQSKGDYPLTHNFAERTIDQRRRHLCRNWRCANARLLALPIFSEPGPGGAPWIAAQVRYGFGTKHKRDFLYHLGIECQPELHGDNQERPPEWSPKRANGWFLDCSSDPVIVFLAPLKTGALDIQQAHNSMWRLKLQLRQQRWQGNHSIVGAMCRPSLRRRGGCATHVSLGKNRA